MVLPRVVLLSLWRPTYNGLQKALASDDPARGQGCLCNSPWIMKWDGPLPAAFTP